jgi:hypothetical protein
MLKKVAVAGLLGGVVLMVWTFLVNGILGFNARINMKQIPNERRVYDVLKEEIVEPGRYTCNPELGAEGFPADEPAFSILYGGMGHGAAGKMMLIQLPLFFLAPMIGAWLLSFASREVLSSYGRKVLFFSLIGLLFAVFGDLTRSGIGGYPLQSALILAAHSVIVWTVVGLAVAWRMKPAQGYS